MTTLSPQQNHAYPVDVEFPDLSGYTAGNTGIPYVYTLDSGVAGPHVMINALTHGNEVCGAITVKALLDLGIRPRRGKLTLAFSNIDAYLSFDASKPDASRFVDQDFNRVWTAAKLDDISTDSSELRRARALRPVIDTVDALLDLHSMHERSAPLIVSGPLDKGIELARALGAPATVISDEGHPEGRRMRDYEGFGDPHSPRNALLVECGQHWEPSAVVVAKVLSGALDEADLPADWFAPKPDAMRVIRVTQPVVAKSMDFRFADAYTGLETFAKAGTVIGWNEGEPVVTPYDNCVLVMPSLRQLRPGVAVVRFGQLL
jgi:hypothetical protein